MTNNSMNEEAINLIDSTRLGIAKLKPEFLVTDHVRQLNLEFVARTDKGKLQDDTADGDVRDEQEGPPTKKLKGQNKKRPREARTPKGEKLCLKLFSESGCPYGDKCCFSHDIPLFVSKKPPDIADKCYLFEKFGRCPYSFACRFSSTHITPDFKNVVNEKLWLESKEKFESVRNTLSKEVQSKLWKKRYDFGKSAQILKCIGKTECSKGGPLTGVTNNVYSEPVGVDCSVANGAPLTGTSNNVKSAECSSADVDNIPLNPREKKTIDFKDKLYLAPLTTVGNLPFRRICKEFGADVTCGEMALSINLLQGQQSEWALLKRHHSEDIYGVQVCGAHAEVMTRTAQLLNENVAVDFVDINMGCPIDFIYQKGGGCGLMGRMKKFEEIVYGMTSVLDVPLTVKLRTGIQEHKNIAHNVIEKAHQLGDRIALISLHGRSREQRYTKAANWDYISECRKAADPIPFFGCGDVLSFEDANRFKESSGVAGVMIARGALIKPWIFTEIKEQRHWDISSSERFDILKRYSNYGLEHWGSDTEGVEKTRRFMLEWLSFLYRYIPVGLLETPPQRINERPPSYRGRDDLETLMSSSSCADWIKLSEMLLGPVPENFTFLPKHKANAYQ